MQYNDWVSLDLCLHSCPYDVQTDKRSTSVQLTEPRTLSLAWFCQWQPEENTPYEELTGCDDAERRGIENIPTSRSSQSKMFYP